MPQACVRHRSSSIHRSSQPSYPPTARQRKIHQQLETSCGLLPEKSRPESGRDCLTWAISARQRLYCTYLTPISISKYHFLKSILLEHTPLLACFVLLYVQSCFFSGESTLENRIFISLSELSVAHINFMCVATQLDPPSMLSSGWLLFYFAILASTQLDYWRQPIAR